LADRSENVRRIAAVAALFAEAGTICIAALISPLRADRERARKTVAPRRFIEIYVATPIAVCRQRDGKGLYARAERGEIAEFTGVSSPYEPPPACDVTLHPENDSVSDCVAQILQTLPTAAADAFSSYPKKSSR
jgi:adenylyl-sulfate kinase